MARKAPTPVAALKAILAVVARGSDDPDMEAIERLAVDALRYERKRVRLRVARHRRTKVGARQDGQDELG
jgi:hypothetical protein